MRLYKHMFDFPSDQEPPAIAEDLDNGYGDPVAAYAELWEALENYKPGFGQPKYRGVEVPEDGYPVVWIGGLGFRVTRWVQGTIMAYEILQGRVAREHTGQVQYEDFIAQPHFAVRGMVQTAAKWDDVTE